MPYRYPIDHYADAVRLLGDHQPVVKPLNRWWKALRAHIRQPNLYTSWRLFMAKQAALDAIEAMPTGATFDVSGARRRAWTDEVLPPGCVAA